MSETTTATEVHTVRATRRRFTPEQKRAFLAEASQPGRSVSEVARTYGIAPSLLFKWKTAMDDAANKSLKKNEKVVAESEVKELKDRIRDLERLAGKQAHSRSRSSKKRSRSPGKKSGFRETARLSRKVDGNCCGRCTWSFSSPLVQDSWN